MPRKALLAAFLLAPGLLLSMPASTADASNLVPNGGFEEDSDLDLLPDGWEPRPGAEHLVRRSPVAAHAGGWTLEIGDASNLTPSGVLSAPVPVEAGSRYRLDLWSMLVVTHPSEQRSTFGVDLGIGDARPDVSFPLRLAPEWNLRSVEFLVPYGVESLRVAIDTRGPALLRVDEVRLTPLPFDGNRLPNPGFETGHYNMMPDLWPIPCGVQQGIWLEGITEGARSLYLFVGGWPACSHAVSAPFVLPPGAYELSGDQYTQSPGSGWMEVVVRGDGDDGSGAPLAEARIEARDQDSIRRERVSFCAPEGSAWGQVTILPPLKGIVYWDALRLVRTGDC